MKVKKTAVPLLSLDILRASKRMIWRTLLVLNSSNQSKWGLIKLKSHSRLEISLS